MGLSLRWQVAAASIVVVLLISVFIGVYYPARSARVALQSEKQGLAGAAEMVALSVGVGLNLQEPRAIAAAFAWARRDSSLRFVAVLDSAGTVIATYNPDSLRIPVASERTRRDVHEWREHFVVSAPVRFQDLELGDVILATSLAPIEARTRTDRRAGLAGSAVLLLVGITLSLWTASRITGPIVALRRATEEIASGHYHVAIDISSGAEVGALASAFNAMAEKIRSQLSDLEHQAAELVVARDAALTSTDAKSAFLATMSHEIRTPMNGVIGMLQLMEDGHLSDEQRDFVRTATRSAEALLTIINDILDFSKVEAGKLDLERIEFNLRDTIEDVTTLLSERAHEKQIDLVSAIRPDVPAFVWGDPGRLRQILLNLAGNALKFTESGQVNIRVRREGTSADSAFLRFEITDTGVGIPPDAVTRLFQPFSQADSSTTRRFGGTGLGLAICRQLVEMMGGEITVTSELGVGSTFSFTIYAQPAGTAIAAMQSGSLANYSVLVVDDNETNRTVLQQILTGWGMKVSLADSGPHAIVVLRELLSRGILPTFALLDMEMPGMDGLALGRVIHDDRTLEGMRLILVSSVGLQDEARTSGFAASMQKPVRQFQLRECLLRLLNEGPVASGATPRRIAAPTAPLVRSGEILLVEDNEVNQLVAVEMLKRLGFTVDVAASGLEALSAVERKRYRAVLMDCQMSGMDGFEATAELRRRGYDSDKLPIIAMTANAMQGDRERCLAAGMDDYLSKPVRRAALAAILDRYVQHVPSAAEPVIVSDVTPAAPESEDEDQGSLIGGAIDGEQLQDLLGDDRTTWRRYLDPFLVQARPILSGLYLGMEQQEAATVSRLAHQLKGSAATVGAIRVADLARQMETIAETGSWNDAATMREQMEGAISRVATVTLELS